MPTQTTSPKSQRTSRPAPSSRRTPTRAPFAITSGATSDRGLERDNNEDRFLIAKLGDERTSGEVLVVADGVGGVNGGEVASSLAIESIEKTAVPTLKALAAKASASAIASALRGMFRAADRQIISEGMRRPQLSGMATTLTAAVIIDRRLVVASVGDSRAYLLRGDALQVLTSDQTISNQLVRLGLLPPEAELRHPFHNVLTDFVGGGEAKLHIQVGGLELADGDVLLLCSDGLTDMVKEQEIERILLANRDPMRASERLVMFANDMGGRDNVTAVVARVSSNRNEEKVS